jgi:hypothetical protein
MKAVGTPVFLLACVFALSNAYAGKPTKDDGSFLGNGYPSGPHYNMHFHGKGDTFTCPEPQYYSEITIDPVDNDGIGLRDLVKSCPDLYTCELTDQQFFGKVINMPRDGTEVQVLVESGRKGPKSNPDASTLEVTDWCTQPFDNDAAVFRLPKNADGYAVYSRVTGKPVDGQTFEVLGRSLERVEVECDPLQDDCTGIDVYDLLLLGVVNETGVFVPLGGDGADDFQRVDILDNRGGKGAKNATEITSMFEFTGSVCYVYADDPACDGGVCVATDLCCPVDVNGDYSGSCVDKDNSMFTDLDLNQTCSFADDGVTFWLDETFYCRDYTNEWIFNIADFVDVLFDVKNNGSYNINLRFYPLPLQESKVKP